MKIQLPWVKRQRLDAANRENQALYGLIVAAHRELERMDNAYERRLLTLPHRIALYRREQEFQPRADESGKTWNWPCAMDSTDDTFHTHSVSPRISDAAP